MYYCGLRPEEAVMLRTAGLRLPADNDEWGGRYSSPPPLR
jgi:hypothetical protein